MEQRTREREETRTSETTDEDMVEVWVTIHPTEIPTPILVKRYATFPEIVAAIQAYFAELGEEFSIVGSQILLNDTMYIINANGEIKGDLTYAISENATLTLTREVSGGMSR
ncbi:MAG: hypothetical protein G01um101448_1104 [Parcubacteria group bacterium Gr01-1014_48]|nr:MAG: hypothetical protein Greene041614_1166 [Parcubacteria group bacterium Greene0416_14]TSC71725.1 MAG: hypothetical protein G01um101448_1104 [Parcubacteria group bacterium Gr01-1014_48]TSC99405.1 MAG: hypothetical protein Greene101415_1161 [Parcubacteria group bacterium Greene1014_15]TSD06637.1 MAG: hypothetical protein Greene07144_1138 [Parcubacteria group bacterium Greene0714_4]